MVRCDLLLQRVSYRYLVRTMASTGEMTERSADRGVSPYELLRSAFAVDRRLHPSTDVVNLYASHPIRRRIASDAPF